jgi:uncharacterized membrane protein
LVTARRIIIFNLVAAILFVTSYQFMVYFLQLLKHSQWGNLFFFIGYVPLRGVGYVLMPNFPIYIFILTFIVNAYYLIKARRTSNDQEKIVNGH